MKHTLANIKQLKHRLPNIKTLAMLKMEKNFIAYCEKGYPRQPYSDARQPTSFLIKRITDELRELRQAFRKFDIQTMKEECADISNIVDYLFEQITEFEFDTRKPMVLGDTETQK